MRSILCLLAMAFGLLVFSASDSSAQPVGPWDRCYGEADYEACQQRQSELATELGCVGLGLFARTGVVRSVCRQFAPNLDVRPPTLPRGPDVQIPTSEYETDSSSTYEYEPYSDEDVRRQQAEQRAQQEQYEEEQRRQEEEFVRAEAEWRARMDAEIEQQQEQQRAEQQQRDEEYRRQQEELYRADLAWRARTNEEIRRQQAQQRAEQRLQNQEQRRQQQEMYRAEAEWRARTDADIRRQQAQQRAQQRRQDLEQQRQLEQLEAEAAEWRERINGRDDSDERTGDTPSWYGAYNRTATPDGWPQN